MHESALATPNQEILRDDQVPEKGRAGEPDRRDLHISMFVNPIHVWYRSCFIRP